MNEVIETTTQKDEMLIIGLLNKRNANPELADTIITIEDLNGFYCDDKKA